MKGVLGVSEKQLLYVNTGLIVVFSAFLFLSFVTVQAVNTQGVMVLISEILGGLSVVSAIISLYYIKSEQKYVPVSMLGFLVPWVIFVIGYEIGINANTTLSWIWFVSLYILIIACFIILRISYNRIIGTFKLIPAFMLFINAIFFVYLVALHIWWSLPISEA
ncbi:hypothetical protein H0266_06860 [Halobacillus locisalis]|uniref:Uncharacterized protein n=1 Tax=Halobacillus locisalis TaxID=220753 RepID=A0A838CS35_9BACI|nr:hypothetical protein [Halobacillus locisalis]MBA2174629.1 hypothetical protein [Halobacillus locisalis]